VEGYCTRDDVFAAVPATAFVLRARPVHEENADAATATIRLKAHGLSLADVITFECTEGGDLPPGISAFTVYHPIPLTADLFRVATSQNGTPIAWWASAGRGWSIAVDTYRRLDLQIIDAAARINECLTAHELPISRDADGHYPPVLVGINARMAARAMAPTLQFENPSFRTALDRILAQEAADDVMLAAWKAGKPIQPRPIDADNIEDNAARASGSRAMPWMTGRLC
jgi:hypothetical protein